MVYATIVPTPVVITVRLLSTPEQLVRKQWLKLNGRPLTAPFKDPYGNASHQLLLANGENEVCHDAIVAVSSDPDNRHHGKKQVLLHETPVEFLRYTLPSRYCDSDNLLTFAWKRFGHLTNVYERVKAINQWTHENIEYRYGSGSPDLSASQVILRGYGVCRDFAHVAIALCRAFNLPTRYVTGHLPDIGYIDPGTAMDFHAYFEVYLDGRWNTFDARYYTPRIGRVKIAHGLDAVDTAFTTIYGSARLRSFEVWAYQVNPEEVTVGDPIDLSKRLDGREEVITGVKSRDPLIGFFPAHD
jgi:transglutaminase-like putative cysteine protease